MDRYFEIRIYGVSNELATASGELLLTQDNQTILVLRSNDTYINNPQYFGIAEGSMNIEEILCDGELSFGNLCSDKFEVELFNISDDLSGLDIQVDVTETINGVTTTNRLFTGVIDSSTTDNNNISRTITAYDKGYYLRDKECVEVWDSFWSSSETKTLSSLRNYLLTHLNISYTSKTLPNDSLAITKSELTSITFGDLLQMITELQSAIPHFNREGVLEFITFDTTSTATYTNAQYESGSVDFEDYTTKPMTGIKLYSTSDDLTQEYKFSSTNDNAYTISGNIFLLDLDSTAIDTVLQAMFANGGVSLSELVYIPVSMPMITSDLSTKLGSMFKSPRGNHYILSQTYSGSLLVDQTITCEASGETREQTASSTNNSMVQGKKFSKIEQTIDGISTTVQRVEQVATDAKSTADDANDKADTANTNANASLTLASSVQQTADNLTTRVSAVEDGTTTNASHITQIQQTANALQLAVEQNGQDIENIQTCLLIKVDGVYILAQVADASTDLSNLSYTKLTAQGVDIYSKGDRVAYFRDEGTYSKDFITNGWHMQAANNNNSFNFIRKDFDL